MVRGPPDPNAGFAEDPLSVVRACAVGVDVNEPVAVDEETVAVQSRRLPPSLGQKFVVSPAFRFCNCLRLLA